MRTTTVLTVLVGILVLIGLYSSGLLEPALILAMGCGIVIVLYRIYVWYRGSYDDGKR